MGGIEYRVLLVDLEPLCLRWYQGGCGPPHAVQSRGHSTDGVAGQTTWLMDRWADCDRYLEVLWSTAP